MAARRATKKTTKKAAKAKSKVRKLVGKAKRKITAKKARKTPARKAPVKAKSRKAAATKRKPAKRAVVRLVSSTPKKKTSVRPDGPPPPPPDAVEVSGIYERVMFSERDPNQEVREVFNHYDRDKSGVIEAKEFARLCEALGVELEDDELQVGLSIVDSDNDGRITWNEFLGWWQSR